MAHGAVVAAASTGRKEKKEGKKVSQVQEFLVLSCVELPPPQTGVEEEGQASSAVQQEEKEGRQGERWYSNAAAAGLDHKLTASHH